MAEEYWKKAERKIREWLDRPAEGYCFERIPDQMTGQKGSTNKCDFTLYKHPYMYYLESKATIHDRFDFSMITEYQHTSLLERSTIDGVFGYVIVLFVEYKRAFMLDINDIKSLEDRGIKSLNIKKIAKWPIPYKEIKTIPNNRKDVLDYDKENNVL